MKHRPSILSFVLSALVGTAAQGETTAPAPPSSGHRDVDDGRQTILICKTEEQDFTFVVHEALAKIEFVTLSGRTVADANRFDNTHIIATLEARSADWPEEAAARSFTINRLNGKFSTHFLGEKVEGKESRPILDEGQFTETCEKGTRHFQRATIEDRIERSAT
jgi:hypothetical protein